VPVKDDLEILKGKLTDLVNWIAESSLEDKPARFSNAEDRNDAIYYDYYDFFNAIHTDVLEEIEVKNKEIEERKSNEPVSTS
jgi:hypothetical protein